MWRDVRGAWIVQKLLDIHRQRVSHVPLNRTWTIKDNQAKEETPKSSTKGNLLRTLTLRKPFSTLHCIDGISCDTLSIHRDIGFGMYVCMIDTVQQQARSDVWYLISNI